MSKSDQPIVLSPLQNEILTILFKQKNGISSCDIFSVCEYASSLHQVANACCSLAKEGLILKVLGTNPKNRAKSVYFITDEGSASLPGAVKENPSFGTWGGLIVENAINPNNEPEAESIRLSASQPVLPDVYSSSDAPATYGSAPIIRLLDKVVGDEKSPSKNKVSSFVFVEAPSTPDEIELATMDDDAGQVESFVDVGGAFYVADSPGENGLAFFQRCGSMIEATELATRIVGKQNISDHVFILRAEKSVRKIIRVSDI